MVKATGCATRVFGGHESEEDTIICKEGNDSVDHGTQLRSGI